MDIGIDIFSHWKKVHINTLTNEVRNFIVGKGSNTREINSQLPLTVKTSGVWGSRRNSKIFAT